MEAAVLRGKCCGMRSAGLIQSSRCRHPVKVESERGMAVPANNASTLPLSASATPTNDCACSLATISAIGSGI